MEQRPVAIVTGGSRGLGREIVEGLARDGHDVVVASRKIDACRAVAEQVAATHGVRALPVACHMGDWAAQEELLATVLAEFGRVDVLVNNAGMSPVYDSLDQVSEELFDKVLGVNLKGPFRLTALVGGHMAQHGGGSVVNISSVAAVRPTVHDLPYAAAKAGLNVLTQGFAQSLGPSVRVNGVMAGPFLTDVSKAWDMEAVQVKLDDYPLRRAGRPEEIVGTVSYLAGPASSYTTGTVITVDGGRTAR